MKNITLALQIVSYFEEIEPTKEGVKQVKQGPSSDDLAAALAAGKNKMK